MRTPTARSVFFPKATLDPAQRDRLEDAFFRSLRSSAGGCKRTAVGHLAEADRMLLRHLPAGSRLRVLDVGVSSGVTTVELAERLAAAGHCAHVVGIDVAMHARLRPMLAGTADILVDRDGRVLQVAWLGRARSRPHVETGSWQRRLFCTLLRRLERLDRSRGVDVRLVSWRTRDRDDVAIAEGDVLVPNPAWRGRFDVVRAANVLHRDVLTPPQLATAVATLASYVAPGGTLVYWRTSEDGTAEGTLLRRSEGDGPLSVLERLGGGSDLETLLYSVANR